MGRRQQRTLKKARFIHERVSLITASRRQELRIGAAEGVAEKVEGLHGTLLAAP
jgi:hypothetical protein